MTLDDHLMTARVHVLHDLEATGAADPDTVSLLEESLSQRAWWLEQWPAGNQFVVGLVAQDVQDGLLGSAGRWPLCPRCENATHALYVDPDLGGPDPHWGCEEAGVVVGRIGTL